MKFIKDLTLRLALCFIILFSNIFYYIMYPLTYYTTYLILRIFYNIQLGDYSYIIGSYEIKLIEACIGISAYILITFLIFLTYGIPWKQRFKILGLGIILIYLMNIIRLIFSIFILTNYSYDLFNKFHLLFWTILSTLYVFGVWIFLIYKFKIKTIPIYSDYIKLKRYLKKLK